MTAGQKQTIENRKKRQPGQQVLTKEPACTRLALLREQMRIYGIDVYLIVSDDFHASEYVGDYFKSREYISGFDGSAGTLVITQTEAGLWTDGRYFIQAAEQLDGTGIMLRKIGEPKVPSILQYLQSTLRKGQSLGYDGRTVCAGYAGAIKANLKEMQIKFEETVDLVGLIWKDRPALPSEDIWILPEEYAGASREQKLKELREKMKEEGADSLLLTSLDDIAWLYNIRGNDISYNPVALAYTLVDEEKAILYINQRTVGEAVKKELEEAGVQLRSYLDVYRDVSEMRKGSRIWMDETVVNVALREAVPAGVNILNKANPTTASKAVKNPVETENVRQAHVKDGIAVTKLIYWLKIQQGSEIQKAGELRELTVCEKLEELRRQQEGYLEPSFAPISAFGAHGAIVHYEPTKATDIPLVDNSFLLLDTGGQYLQGTTDITRTIGIGTLSEEQKKHYTAVLRGNLNLAAAYFKYGCTGVNLDYLARAPLWELGLDYNHGTGHGVGYLLNVHEGPNAIRLKDAGDSIGTVFEEGMITSDEPGLYLEGEYGIRLENLLLCKKGRKTLYGQFMEFETLTLVPFDREAILPELMSEKELELLNAYHARVFEKISPHLSEEERHWLAEETEELKK